MVKDLLTLYEPINTLKPVDNGIWLVDGPIVKMSMYGMAIPFTTRMTVVRLGNGGLWCHSPIELTSTLKAEIDNLGLVEHLVSPNKIHYAHIQSWVDAYPRAIAWASPGVRERADSQHIPTTFHADLDDTPPPQWATEIDQAIVRGSRFLDEVVFFHRQSKTLILTDLIENVEPSKIDKTFRWLIHLVGIADPNGKAPLDLRMTFWNRKAQARKGYEQMLAWAPEKIILAHGRWFSENGVAELERAFQWLK
ncbi:DUF4336 domain-containing protein [Nodosilinea sp. FACHB-131]|uniref:DUF4336 domain-containing protein n=1 Tax=Cyanophyceae TaxID=3028117 RepID=UPI001688DE18|nr:DUF4336 domain-containing protein [Nodosilinea sp. FACHB-131]MBD1874745.1 DUF4336 domain-containing protein [Nodosilinea sp. FACHB-131]